MALTKKPQTLTAPLQPPIASSTHNANTKKTDDMKDLESNAHDTNSASKGVLEENDHIYSCVLTSNFRVFRMT